MVEHTKKSDIYIIRKGAAGRSITKRAPDRPTSSWANMIEWVTVTTKRKKEKIRNRNRNGEGLKVEKKGWRRGLGLNEESAKKGRKEGRVKDEKKSQKKKRIETQQKGQRQRTHTSRHEHENILIYLTRNQRKKKVRKERKKREGDVVWGYANHLRL